MKIRCKKGGARLNTNTPKLPKEKTKKASKIIHNKRQKLLRGLYVAVTIVAALIVAGFIVQALFIERPTLSTQTDRRENNKTTDQLEDDDSGLNALSAERKENVWTFLVVGLDTGGGGNTDTMMLVTYDIPNQQLNVMSLPRDTIINESWKIPKLNAVYNYAVLYDRDGMEFLAEHVADIVGFYPDFTITLEWEAVGKLVDAIGGVYFDVPINMNYDDPTQDLHIHVNKGYQYVDGDKAMQIIRYRLGNNGGGYVGGDLERIQTQQAFLKVVIEACLQFQNVTKINELSKIFTENVETALTVNNLAWFGKEAIIGGLTMDNVNLLTMPNSLYSYGGSYVIPTVDELLEMVNEYFNPYKEDIQASELNLFKGGSKSSSSSSSSSTKSSGSTSSGSSSSATKATISSAAAEESLNPDSTTTSAKTTDTAQNANRSDTSAGSGESTASQTPVTQAPAVTEPESAIAEPESGPGMEPTE